MPQVLNSIFEQVRLTTVLDVGITALLIYWLFSLIRGTSAVRLVIGVSVLFVVYFIAQLLSLRLLTQILQAGAVVGLFALVVVFQPELRRALDRIGRVGSLGWLLSAEGRDADQVAADVARAAALLSAEGHGALIVLERETGLEEIAETGVMIHGDLSVDLLRTIFTPKSALHDGAVIVRATRVLAAGAVLPLAETTVHPERFGTRHRAALGVTEQTDAVVVVVSEENGQISLVQRARIIRNLNEAQLARALRDLLRPAGEQNRIRAVAAGLPAPNRSRFGRLVRGQQRDAGPELDLVPPSEELVLPAGAPPEPQLARPLDDGRPARIDDRTAVRSARPGMTVRSPDVGPRDEAAARSAGSGR
jgi:diadenylate cyclase